MITNPNQKIITNMDDAINYGIYIDMYFGKVCKQMKLDYNAAISDPLEYLILAGYSKQTH